MGIRKISALFYISLMLIISSTSAARFTCDSTGTACNSIIDYVSPNATTLSVVMSRFNVTNLPSFLGANDFPPTTPPTQRVTANQTIKIPFRCRCSNGTGKSDGVPLYTVVPGDGLYHIAAEVFSNLVTFQEIQAANNITDPDLIEIGQSLWIPLPCSCDDVDGQRVVHYGHVVPSGSSVEGIARQYNTSQDVLLRLNGLASPNDLLAGAVLDVPLRACTSMVGNNSRDYPFLVSNGTYFPTAGDCVTCRCDAANNWTLQCAPSQLRSSIWPTCPSMQCLGAQGLTIGNTTTSGCNRTTCSYAGYTNQGILTTLSRESTCPASPPDNNGSSVISHGWRWNFIMVVVFQLMLLCLHF